MPAEATEALDTVVEVTGMVSTVFECAPLDKKAAYPHGGDETAGCIERVREMFEDVEANDDVVNATGFGHRRARNLEARGEAAPTKPMRGETESRPVDVYQCHLVPTAGEEEPVGADATAEVVHPKIPSCREVAVGEAGKRLPAGDPGRACVPLHQFPNVKIGLPIKVENLVGCLRISPAPRVGHLPHRVLSQPVETFLVSHTEKGREILQIFLRYKDRVESR